MLTDERIENAEAAFRATLSGELDEPEMIANYGQELVAEVRRLRGAIGDWRVGFGVGSACLKVIINTIATSPDEAIKRFLALPTSAEIRTWDYAQQITYRVVPVRLTEIGDAP